jgi:hypothetical protein
MIPEYLYYFFILLLNIYLFYIFQSWNNNKNFLEFQHFQRPGHLDS